MILSKTLFNLSVTKGTEWIESEKRVQGYGQDPERFFQEALGAEIYDKQIEILNAVRSSRRVAVCGANETGKDWTSGRIILWWMTTRKPAKVIVIGRSHRQVRDIVWKEMRSAYMRSTVPLGGQMYKTPRWEFDDDSFALGFATDDEFNIQGFHSPHLLAIITEAHAVPQSHIDAIKRLHPSCLLLTGNPFTSQGEFYEAFHSNSHIYNAIRMTAFDSPNVKQKQEVIPGLVTIEDIEDAKLEYSEDSSFYRGSILGEFVGEEETVVVPMEFVKRCQENPPKTPKEPIELGVDVGAGGDETVIRERRGVKVGRVWRKKTKDFQVATGLVIEAIKATKATQVKIDSIGIGWGVAGRLEELKGSQHNAEILSVNVGEASSDPSRFPKLRDQIWWEVGRELSEEVAWDLSECDKETLSQLCAPRWTRDSANRVKVEPKEQTRKRLGRSPDDADALLLAFYSPPKRHHQIWL